MRNFMHTTYHSPLLRISTFLFLCAIFLFVNTTNTLGAQTLSDRLNKIQKEIKTTATLQSIKEKQAALIKRQIQNISTEAKTLEKKITKTKDDLERINHSITDLRENIAKQTRALTGQKKVLAQLIRNQYEVGTETPTARILLPRTHILNTDDYITQTQKRIHETITHMIALRTKMEHERTKLEKKKNDAKDLTEKLQKRNDYLESTRNYKSYLASKTNQEIQQYRKKISQLEQEEIAIRREIERIELTKIDNVNFANLPSKKDADFGYPVKTVRISQYYGRTHFSKKAYRNGFHNGIDFAGGGNILAAADGKVLATGNMKRYGYGRWVAIDHGNGLVTLYGHMKKIKVSRGKKVDKGDVIGIMGSTGYSTGVHVHFSVFVKSSFSIVNSSRVAGLKIPTGASINPLIYL